MSKIEALGARSTDNSEWNHAWSVVSQLAAARGTLRELDQDGGGAAIPDVSVDAGHHLVVAPPADAKADAKSASAPAVDPAPFAVVAPDQLARDIAEIERAAAALRRAEPALEPRLPDLPAIAQPRTSRSIWLLVCAIWLIAAAVVSCAIGAVVLFLS